MTTGPHRGDFEHLNQRLATMGADIVKPYPGAPAGTSWSAAPGFKPIRAVGEHTDERGVKSTKVQHLLDPEKHIEFTSRYEGSTDRQHPFTGERQSASDVWIDKKAEAKQPAGARTPTGRPVHGAGIVDSLQSGESIRNPVRLVSQAERFPLSKGHAVQSEGHHRVAGAALEQKRRRDAGDADWSVPVPYTMHATVPEAKVADAAGAKLASVQSALLNRSRAKTFQMATGSRTIRLDTMHTLPSPQAAPKRRWLRRRG